MLPQLVDQPEVRDHNLLYCCYSLDTQTPLVGAGALTRHFQLGRFADHFDKAINEMPKVLANVEWESCALTIFEAAIPITFHSIKTMLLSSPFSGSVLLLQLDFDSPLEVIVDLLVITCFKRDQLMLMNKPMLLATIDKGKVRSPEHIQLGRDVHQIVVPSTKYASGLFHNVAPFEVNLDTLLSLIYREQAPHRPEIHSLRFPTELNRRIGSLGAHARGVSVFVRQAIHVENAALLTVISLLGALTRLRNIRLRTQKALQLTKAFALTDHRVRESLALISRLQKDIAELEIDLSFAVEAYLDSILLPEVVIDSYRQSIAGILGIQEGLVATNRMLERLTATVQARARDLSAYIERDVNERRRRWTVALAYLTAVALPLSLLFAFLSMGTNDVSHNTSILNFVYYRGIYATILGLVSTGVVLYLAMLLTARRRWTEARGGFREVNVFISAHRGNCGTLDLPLAESYKRAIDLNVDYVEFDVRKTKDGIYVIWHDDHTPSNRRVCDLSFEEYQDELGDQTLTVPQLLTMAKGRVGLHFDLKEAGYEDEIVRLALSYLSVDDFVITSLEDKSVRAIKEKFPPKDFPTLKVGLSLGRDLEGAGPFMKLRIRLSELFPGRRLRKSHADFVAVHHRLATTNVLRHCKRKRIPAWIWTVDDELDMMRFLNDPRVTTLISNKPEVALSLRATNAI